MSRRIVNGVSFEDCGVPFRTLTEAEEVEFRNDARENPPPDLEKWDLYHPVCRDEWEKMGIKPLQEKL